jgi:phosphatidylethanolamine/phosphatidyl-N-methylethanolamine N-methyltransferase
MSAKTTPLRLFLSELAKRPKQMGTVWPSSPALAEAMARWLPENKTELMLELGPGTGIVTEKLLEAGLPEEKLVAVEKSERLAGFLRERFPKARIISGDALELDQVLSGLKFGAVFSSLPLKVFSPEQVERISAAIHNVLVPGAHWVQYSYQIINGHAPAKSFHAVDSEIVWQNLPPAKVSVYRRSATV